MNDNNSYATLLPAIVALENEEKDLLHQLVQVQESLKKARSAVQKLKNTDAARGSYISRIPAELLVTIFKYGVTFSLKGKRFELLISHVCQGWRHLAINAPSLWTVVRIYPYCSSNLVTLYFKRSRNLPLDILYEATTFKYYEEGRILSSQIADCNQTIPLVIACIHRWKKFHVSTLEHLGYHVFSSFADLYAPLLEDLSLSLVDDEYTSRRIDGPTGPKLSLLAGGIPRLTSLKLHSLPVLLSVIPTDVHIFTSLTISCTTTADPPLMKYKDFYSLLSSLHALINLEIIGCPVVPPPKTSNNLFGPPPEDQPGSILMPSLRSLIFKETISGVLIEPLLGLISAPELEHLSLLYDFGNEYDFDISQGYDHQTNLPKHPLLKSLTLTGGHQSKKFINDIPHSFPTVEHVTFGAGCSNAFLRNLEENIPVPIGFCPSFGYECSLWPELRKIEFHEPCLDWVVLSEFLRKRKANNQPLETLRLCHTWEEMVEVYPMLVASLERYVKVELSVIREEEDLI